MSSYMIYDPNLPKIETTYPFEKCLDVRLSTCFQNQINATPHVIG